MAGIYSKTVSARRFRVGGEDTLIKLFSWYNDCRFFPHEGKMEGRNENVQKRVKR